MRNFATILAISAVVGTMLLVLVFLLPVGPMRRNVEKSVGDMLKTGDEIPEDAFTPTLRILAARLGVIMWLCLTIMLPSLS